ILKIQFLGQRDRYLFFETCPQPRPLLRRMPWRFRSRLRLFSLTPVAFARLAFFLFFFRHFRCYLLSRFRVKLRASSFESRVPSNQNQLPRFVSTFKSLIHTNRCLLLCAARS